MKRSEDKKIDSSQPIANIEIKATEWRADKENKQAKTETRSFIECEDYAKEWKVSVKYKKIADECL